MSSAMTREDPKDTHLSNLPRKDPKDMNVQWVFLGCPGVGKGTYASRLCNLLRVPHIATGDLVREELASSGPLSQQCLDNTQTIVAVRFIKNICVGFSSPVSHQQLRPLCQLVKIEILLGKSEKFDDQAAAVEEALDYEEQG
ncbi:hypothetical protein FNV43_RR11781 [Rhamnella rubrinervis]|uniref:adenylate kinase n=1 Tax=Rhamnella rubrinervis TaxID=2594499 RepID=A0A8K0MHY0_9ROSA|nr:hypothetical protein FNV43_RR11781 [Rhamnella rubrinervis]